MIGRLHRWWLNRKYPPSIELSHSSQATESPMVNVSAISMGGRQSIYTWNADSQGEASAEMYGRSLAEILRLRLVDRRDPKEVESFSCK